MHQHDGMTLVSGSNFWGRLQRVVSGGTRVRSTTRFSSGFYPNDAVDQIDPVLAVEAYRIFCDPNSFGQRQTWPPNRRPLGRNSGLNEMDLIVIGLFSVMGSGAESSTDSGIYFKYR